MALEHARERLAEAGRRLAEAGLAVGTSGNVSERHGELVTISAQGASLARLSAEQIAVVDLDGVQVDGEYAPTSELALHLGVYRRYDAGAVAHTHGPAGTALACVGDELPCVHYQLATLGGPVRVARYETFGTPELAEVTVEALAGRCAALMGNHGAIVHAEDIDAAVERAVLLEWGCDVYLRASAFGSPRLLDEQQQQAVRDALAARSYSPL